MGLLEQDNPVTTGPQKAALVAHNPDSGCNRLGGYGAAPGDMGILWGILVRDPGGVGDALGGISAPPQGPHGGGARSAATGDVGGATGDEGGPQPQVKGRSGRAGGRRPPHVGGGQDAVFEADLASVDGVEDEAEVHADVAIARGQVAAAKALERALIVAPDD